MLMLAAMLACGAVQDPDTVKVTLDVQDASMGQLLDMLRTISKVPIDIDEAAKKAVDFDREQVSIKLQDIALTAALQLVLGPHKLEVKVVDKKKVLITVPKK
jgi:hypothetical protein